MVNFISKGSRRPYISAVNIRFSPEKNSIKSFLSLYKPSESVKTPFVAFFSVKLYIDSTRDLIISVYISGIVIKGMTNIYCLLFTTHKVHVKIKYCEGFDNRRIDIGYNNNEDDQYLLFTIYYSRGPCGELVNKREKGGEFVF